MERTRTAALLLVAFVASCTSRPTEPTARARDLASRSAVFGLKFHGEVLRRTPGKNVFLSPVSAFLALSMAASGAAGPTHDEMAAALELQGRSGEDVDGACGDLLEWLRGGFPEATLEVANSAWLRKDFPFHDAYVRRLEDRYHAEAVSIDFSDPKTLGRIDAWAAEHTRGKIAKAAPQGFDVNDVLLLLNAVYFQGSWDVKFPKSATRTEDFILADGKRKPLPFMRRTGHFELLEADGLQAIRIPYGREGRLSLVLVLPKEGQSLLQLHDALQPTWAAMRSRFRSERVDLQLPRFRLELETDLGESLAGMGMKRAFGREADFSGMSPKGKDLHLSAVRQKTFVDVNEEGTEAAATTTVVAAAKAEMPGQPKVFRVDRPFFCAIVDETTGALLFTGSIVEPN